MHLKMSSAKWRQFRLGLNVLTKCRMFPHCRVGFILQNIKIYLHFLSLLDTEMEQIVEIIQEVWEWIYNFIPYFIMDVVTYSCSG